jgi:hypothetical protein
MRVWASCYKVHILIETNVLYASNTADLSSAIVSLWLFIFFVVSEALKLSDKGYQSQFLSKETCSSDCVFASNTLNHYKKVGVIMEHNGIKNPEISN